MQHNLQNFFNLLRVKPYNQAFPVSQQGTVHSFRVSGQKLRHVALGKVFRIDFHFFISFAFFIEQVVDFYTAQAGQFKQLRGSGRFFNYVPVSIVRIFFRKPRFRFPAGRSGWEAVKFQHAYSPPLSLFNDP